MNTIVTTTIWMNEENIHKFINLYGEGNGKFSLSLVVPEPKEWTKEMFSGDCPDWYENTCMRSNNQRHATRQGTRKNGGRRPKVRNRLYKRKLGKRIRQSQKRKIPIWFRFRRRYLTMPTDS